MQTSRLLGPQLAPQQSVDDFEAQIAELQQLFAQMGQEAAPGVDSAPSQQPAAAPPAQLTGGMQRSRLLGGSF